MYSVNGKQWKKIAHVELNQVTLYSNHTVMQPVITKNYVILTIIGVIGSMKMDKFQKKNVDVQLNMDKK